MIERDAEG